MAKEILIYSFIHNFAAETFIEKMEAAKDEDVVVRINTSGGDPQAGFGMISKFAEHGGAKTVKVDGKANSMGAFFLAYAENVEALDVSEIIVHRAAFPSYFESREDFKSSEEFKALAKVNKSLRSGLEAKIDVAKFEKIAGVTMDEVFSMDSRIDVSLTPSQAKQIGLVNKVNKLTAEMKAEIQSNSIQMAAHFGVDVADMQIEPEEVIEAKHVDNQADKTKKNNTMTIDKLKAEHPEVYAQAVKVGVSQEKDRVEAILAYSEIDLPACVAAVESGENMSQKFMAEMQVKGMKAAASQEIEDEGADDLDDGEDGDGAEDGKTEDEKALEEFNANVDSNFKSE